MAVELWGSSEMNSGSLALLQTRLRRLEFLLTGHSEVEGVRAVAGKWPKSAASSVHARLSALERELDRLRRMPGAAGDLIRDIESLHASVPDAAGTHPTIAGDDLATKASLVLSHATLYPETASRLSSLQTLPVPAAEQSAQLSALRGQIQTRQHVQDSLELDIQDLQHRSARCLEWWIKVGVAGMGDVWDDWQDRIADIEGYLTRLERRKKEHQGYL
ncbi:hypothetical protein DV737_g3616, partial [Chaetothyriales sp. CBS 132003]